VASELEIVNLKLAKKLRRAARAATVGLNPEPWVENKRLVDRYTIDREGIRRPVKVTRVFLSHHRKLTTRGVYLALKSAIYR
jgi:hypothetical protein